MNVLANVGRLRVDGGEEEPKAAVAAAVAELVARLTMLQHTAAAADEHIVGSTGGMLCSQDQEMLQMVELLLTLH